jgi:hypothetical protein
MGSERKFIVHMFFTLFVICFLLLIPQEITQDISDYDNFNRQVNYSLGISQFSQFFVIYFIGLSILRFVAITKEIAESRKKLISTLREVAFQCESI